MRRRSKLSRRLTAYAALSHRRWFTAAGGAICSILLHATLLHSVLYGGAQERRRAPDSQGFSAHASESSDEPTMTLIFLELDNAESDEATDFPASRGAAPKTGALVVASDNPASAAPPETSDADVSQQAASTSAIDAQARSILFGQYTGQVHARIERAWLRPRAPISAAPATDSVMFHCEARIEQDQQGRVLEVMLVACNGSSGWQQSLVSAIERASPLPAPPHPSVFTHALTLRFDSDTFEPGGSPNGFEPPEIRVTRYDENHQR